MYWLKWSGRRKINPFFICIFAFWVLKGLNDMHHHWGEQCALLSLTIQMLISSRNTLMDTPRNTVESGHTVNPSRWCIKLAIIPLLTNLAMAFSFSAVKDTSAFPLVYSLFLLRSCPWQALENHLASMTHPTLEVQVSLTTAFLLGSVAIGSLLPSALSRDMASLPLKLLGHRSISSKDSQYFLSHKVPTVDLGSVKTSLHAFP